jgi:hypothetical protein
MSGAVRTPVQGRDEAVQPAEPAVATITAPWVPRADGKTALLVSERTTVFDRKLPPPVETVEVAADPIWDDKAGTAWTPDLVHCRLLLMAETIQRLPEVLRKRYVSQIGRIAVSEGASERRSPPTPSQISLADWTLERLFELPERTRQLLIARAYGFSYDKIVERFAASGKSKGNDKKAIIAWDRDARRYIAADWQGRKHALDLATYERWGELFAGRQK